MDRIEHINDERKKAIIDKLKKEKAERMKKRIERFENMRPFRNVDDIPEIPIMDDKAQYENVVVKNLIRCGAIPKDKLVIGKTYIGKCRNANEAVWNGRHFEYKRFKFGYMMDDVINHFQDDNGYDLFVPIQEKDEP